jgi:hypothetical protein
MWYISTIWVAWRTTDARCKREIKCEIAMAKAAFSKKQTLSTSRLGLNLRQTLV